MENDLGKVMMGKMNGNRKWGIKDERMSREVRGIRLPMLPRQDPKPPGNDMGQVT
jgi:hypothetical protein